MRQFETSICTVFHRYHHITLHHTTIAESHNIAQHRIIGFFSAGGHPLMVAKECWGVGVRAKNGSNPHPRGLSVREGEGDAETVT